MKDMKLRTDLHLSIVAIINTMQYAIRYPNVVRLEIRRCR